MPGRTFVLPAAMRLALNIFQALRNRLLLRHYLLRTRQQFGSAAEVINRAIAQGAGSDAWEELGHVYTAQNDAPRAQSSYANALRLQRGEPARALGDRSLREIIADEAVAEQRDEHGLPRLRH